MARGTAPMDAQAQPLLTPPFPVVCVLFRTPEVVDVFFGHHRCQQSTRLELRDPDPSFGLSEGGVGIQFENADTDNWVLPRTGISDRNRCLSHADAVVAWGTPVLS